MKYSPETNQRLINALTEQFDTFHNELANRNVASKKLTVTYEKLPNKGIDFDTSIKLSGLGSVPI